VGRGRRTAALAARPDQPDIRELLRRVEADLSAARQPVQLRGRVHESRPGTYRMRNTISLITGAAGDVA